ncbi:putative ABC transporter ATP-binding protein [Pseudolycoriella hygida]|uniref:ABC transporter ATP-binding protein n=1 Tax=Pseudolycoriella hygida TaxID=35572 RepID=A0A9Q0N8K4_9DIPT|nr:putative ABC transporter ATP-binding protein [Pseudolycoriella hygida]
MGGILCILGYLSLKNAITPGDFALVFLINYKIAEKLLEISYKLVEFIQTFTIASNAVELVSKKEEASSGYGVLENKIGDIVFENVTFGYEKTRTLFQNLSLTIKNKQNIGIVGYSGSGKSTLTNLILRLYGIQNGKILINGNDINDISKEFLYQNIGLIPQEPTLFNRTIFENISYGLKDASLAQVIEAAKQAEAHTFISNLPNGYNTLVGERGMKLSGGQRQRMVIARTILKNAPILVMDEATSSLDSITENAIRDFLVNFAKAKTSIIIAHRISTLLNMDRILVLDNGKIVEDGTHSELVAQNGLYAKMWSANSNGFLGINSNI